MRRKAILVLVLAALAAAGCMVHTSSIRLSGAGDLPAAEPGTVEVYLSEKDVPGAFDKLALVFAEEVWGNLDYADLVARLRARAAKLGANGLILGEMEDRLSVNGAAAPCVVSSDKVMRGLAIRVRK